MTAVQAEKIARRKLSLLQLAQELGNVSKACRIVGYSRQQFYEIRRNFQLHGADGLLDQLPGAKGPHPNRVPAAVEGASDARRPARHRRTAAEGDPGQFGRGAGVWIRNDLQTRHHRLLRLEETVWRRTRRVQTSDQAE